MGGGGSTNDGPQSNSYGTTGDFFFFFVSGSSGSGESHDVVTSTCGTLGTHCNGETGMPFNLSVIHTSALLV